MGVVPEWYTLFIAADRLHCTPMEVLDLPTEWFEWALIATEAENKASQGPEVSTQSL